MLLAVSNLRKNHPVSPKVVGNEIRKRRKLKATKKKRPLETTSREEEPWEDELLLEGLEIELIVEGLFTV